MPGEFVIENEYYLTILSAQNQALSRAVLSTLINHQYRISNGFSYANVIILTT